MLVNDKVTLDEISVKQTKESIEKNNFAREFSKVLDPRFPGYQTVVRHTQLSRGTEIISR